MLASRSGRAPIDARAVGRELHAHAPTHSVLDEFEEVTPHHRLAAADVDVEDLHVGDLVDQRQRFTGREFARVATAR